MEILTQLDITHQITHVYSILLKTVVLIIHISGNILNCKTNILRLFTVFWISISYC